MSKLLGVALLLLQKFLSKFISRRGISPRPLQRGSGRGGGGESSAVIRFGMQEKWERAALEKLWSHEMRNHET